MGTTDTISEPRHGNLGQTTASETDPDALLSSEADVELDRVFKILKNERRRQVLTYLDRVGGPVGIGELAEELAAHENDTTPARVDSTQRKRVYVALYQCHLPKMAELGVVDYDRRAGVVELTEGARPVLAMADRPIESRQPWHRYYGGVSAGTTAVFAANYLGLLPVHLAANVFTGFVIAVLVVLSMTHRVLTRRGASDP